MGLIFLDSSLVIHASDNNSADGQLVRERLGSSGRRFAVSPLVKLECLVLSLRLGDTKETDRRRTFMEGFTNLMIEEDAFELATHIRAIHGLSTPDAIHVATARVNECDELWTSDVKLGRSMPGFTIEISLN